MKLSRKWCLEVVIVANLNFLDFTSMTTTASAFWRLEPRLHFPFFENLGKHTLFMGKGTLPWWHWREPGRKKTTVSSKLKQRNACATGAWRLLAWCSTTPQCTFFRKLLHAGLSFISIWKSLLCVWTKYFSVSYEGQCGVAVDVWTMCPRFFRFALKFGPGQGYEAIMLLAYYMFSKFPLQFECVLFKAV